MSFELDLPSTSFELNNQKARRPAHSPSSLVPEYPYESILVSDELLESVKEWETSMPDLVENGLKDDDGEGGEEGRGEEVHLERTKRECEIDQLRDEAEEGALESVRSSTDLMQESVGVWDDVVALGDELRARETLHGKNWLLCLVQTDIASSRSTRDVVTKISLSNDCING